MKSKVQVYEQLVSEINTCRAHLYSARTGTLDPVWFNRLSQAIRNLANFTQAVQAVGGAS